MNPQAEMDRVLTAVREAYDEGRWSHQECSLSEGCSLYDAVLAAITAEPEPFDPEPFIEQAIAEMDRTHTDSNQWVSRGNMGHDGWFGYIDGPRPRYDPFFSGDDEPETERLFAVHIEKPAEPTFLNQRERGELDAAVSWLSDTGHPENAEALRKITTAHSPEW